MGTYTIRLDDDTCGTLSAVSEPRIGDTVTVRLHDENGMPISVTGQVAEILDAEESA